MAAVAGQHTTFNMPNYVGELFSVVPADTPFLSMIGGLTGGKRTTSKQFSWQTVDNAAAAQPGILEGAEAVYAGRDRTEVFNVVQIFQEAVEVSYTKSAAVGNLDGQAIVGNQPVQDEMAFQVMLKLEKIARDVEFTFLQGAYLFPADNLTARTTRGMLTAVTTNAVAAGATALSKAHIDSVLLQMFNSGAPMRQPVIFLNGFQKQGLSSIYGYAPEHRNVGGVNITNIETDFGIIGVAPVDRHMPAGSVLVADVSVCAPVILEIPGKGFLFEEELAKTGAYERRQLYGEIGLEYGPEQWHGKITGLTTS